MKLPVVTTLLISSLLFGVGASQPHLSSKTQSTNKASTYTQNCKSDGGSSKQKVPRLKKGTFTYKNVTSTYYYSDIGVNKKKPVNIVIRLHGDGTYEQSYPQQFLACLAGRTLGTNTVFAAPRSPDKKTNTWWQSMSKNTEWVNAYKKSLEKKYGTKGKVILHGYSGGAELISYGILPKHPTIADKTVMIGGGGAYSVKNKTPKNRLYWFVGERDTGAGSSDGFNALKAAKKGYSLYKKKGWKASIKVVPRANHYNIKQMDKMIPYL